MFAVDRGNAKRSVRRVYDQPPRPTFPTEKHQIPTDVLLRGLGEIIDTLEVPFAVEGINASFSKVSLVGGYHWMNSEEPSIVVPGDGARLSPGTSSLEPIFLSLNDTATLDDIDLVTDRANLRKIYRTIVGFPGNWDAEEWRIEAQCIGDTVLFTQWEEEDTVKGRDGFRGYRMGLLKQVLGTPSTASNRPAGTQMLVKYKFGKQRLLVRYSVDACLPSDDAGAAKAGSLEDMLDKLNLEEGSTSPTSGANGRSSVTVIRTERQLPPRQSLLEITTRKHSRKLDLVDTYGRLVFSQSPCLYVARHRAGDFSQYPVERITLKDRELEFEAKLQAEPMSRVAGLLSRMVDIAKEQGDVAFCFVEDRIEVRMLMDKVPLSPEAAELLGSAR
ncbi:hypothetical protein P7C73_g2205, partial [Tremellales sp. Uapishka_1]